MNNDINDIFNKYYNNQINIKNEVSKIVSNYNNINRSIMISDDIAFKTWLKKRINEIKARTNNELNTYLVALSILSVVMSLLAVICSSNLLLNKEPILAFALSIIAFIIDIIMIIIMIRIPFNKDNKKLICAQYILDTICEERLKDEMNCDK